MRNLVTFIATGAYTGYSPLAPGTVGTLWGVALWALVWPLGTGAQALTTVLVFGVSVLAADRAEKQWGESDPSRIVCDEVAGFMVASLLVPFTPVNAILAFLLFRFFDILKPYPIRALERRIPGGLGVVVDDVVAGVYANLGAQIALHYLR